MNELIFCLYAIMKKTWQLLSFRYFLAELDLLFLVNKYSIALQN